MYHFVAIDFFRRERVKEIALARKNVLDPGPAVRHHQRGLRAVVRRHAAHRIRFFDVLGIAEHGVHARGLLARVRKHEAYLARIEIQQSAGGGRGAEQLSGRRGVVSRAQIRHGFQRQQRARANVVAENDGAQHGFAG